jgi:glucosylceramidase
MNLLSTSIVLALLLSSAAVAQDNWDGVPLKVYQTSRDNAGDRLTDKGTITLQAGANPSGVHSMIQINTATQYQKILGFGGAFTEASAYVYSTLNDNLKRQVAELFFGPDGIQYSLCRTHINSCDFSLSSYSFDDTPGDFTLSRFDISHARERMLPFIKDCIAKSNRTVNIFASPWSPPAWMKGNNAMPGSSYPGLLADTRVHDAWALYFSKFITAYENEGVPIWGITVQNEPEFAAPWEACVYSAEQQRDFIKNHLGPRMRADHPDKKIMIFDHNKDHVFNWVNTIMSDPAASQYVHGTGFHWYGG